MSVDERAAPVQLVAAAGVGLETGGRVRVHEVTVCAEGLAYVGVDLGVVGVVGGGPVLRLV